MHTKRLLSCLLLSLVSLSFAGFSAAQSHAPAGQASAELHRLLGAYWEDYLRLHPITATFIGDSRYNDRLPINIGHAHRAELKAFYSKYLSALVGHGVVEGVDLALRKCEVGVIIGEPRLWGQGLGKHAVQYLLQHCFEQLKLHRVLAVIARGNTRSERLFQRMGFTHEGTLRDATVIDGQFTDLLCYSMLEDEYRHATFAVRGDKTCLKL